MDKKLIVISLVLIAALGFVIYAPSMNGKFIYDDKFLVQDNTYVKNLSGLPKMFTQDIGSGADQPYSFYRPLQMITYMFDYAIWNLNVIGYHLSNVIMHILAAFSVYWFVAVLFGSNLLALIVGLFFVSHPMHTEAICYISGRSDPLSLIFLMLTFVFYIKLTRKDDVKEYAFMIISYVLAMLARENCMILPLLLLLYNYTFKEKMKPKLFLPILGISILYIILRVTALKFLIQNLPITTTPMQRLPGFFAAMTGYARVLFWPLDLHVEYGAPIFPWNYPTVIAGMYIFLALVAILVAMRKSKIVLFSLAWFFITIFPVANIYPINAYMAEHWLYLPCIGLFMLIASGLAWLYEKRGALRIAAIAITAAFSIFFSFITIDMNEYWKDPIAFYQRTVKYVRTNPKIWDNLGGAFAAAGRDDEAAPCFLAAIRLDPRYAGSYSNLGNVYFRAQRYEEAYQLYKKSVELRPDFALGYNNLGNICVVMGKMDEALKYYNKVIELAPNNPGVYNNIGLVNKMLGNTQAAIDSLNKSISVNPDFPLPYSILSRIYFEQGNKDLAKQHYDKAVSLGQKPDPAYQQELNK